MMQLLFGLAGCNLYIDEDAKKARLSSIVQGVTVVSDDSEITTTSEVRCETNFAPFYTPEADLDLDVAYQWFVDRDAVLGEEQILYLEEHEIDVGSDLTCQVSIQEGALSDSTLGIVTVGNTLPIVDQEANIETLENNDPIQIGQQLRCSADISDHDDGLLTPTYSWTTGDGQQIHTSEIYTVSVEHVMPGDTLTCNVTGADSNGGEVSSAATVEVVNAPPIVSNVAVSSVGGTAYNDGVLQCAADIEDPEREQLTPTYEWKNVTQNILSSSTAMELLLTPSFAAPGDEVKCTVRVTDSDFAMGEAFGSIGIGNRTPEISSVTIAPVQPLADDLVECTVMVSDPDMDELTYEYAWRNLSNSNADLGMTSVLTLTPNDVDPLDLLECSVVVRDPSGAEHTLSATVTIENSAPFFVMPPEISPSSVTTGATLTCDAMSQDINLGDTITTTYQWSMGSQILSGTTFTVPMGVVGETITCEATATDTLLSVTDTTSVVVQNTLPVISNVSISPSVIYNDETNVECSSVVSDIDEVAFTGVPQYTWEDSTGPLASGSSLDLTTTSLMPGDDLICQVAVTDANGGTAQSQMSGVIANRAPSIPVVSIDPIEPVANLTDVTCDATSTDADGQTLSYTYEWTGSLGGTYTGQVLPSISINPGEDWTCEVEVSDGSAGGTVTGSTTVTACDCDFSMSLTDQPDSPVIEMSYVTAGVDPLQNYELTNDFYAMTTEVTQGMYESIMGTDWRNSSGTDAGYYLGDDYPVNYVTWHMAADFANHLTARHAEVFGVQLTPCYGCSNSGTPSANCSWSSIYNPYQCNGYRLPTEAEWEYAARSGGVNNIWTGGGTDVATAISGNLNSYDCDTSVRIEDNVSVPFLTDYAWFCGNTDSPEEVGQKNPNGFNLYDMYGNLYEWTEDVFSYSWPVSNYTINPWYGTIPNSNVKFINRGGSFENNPTQLGSIMRASTQPQLSRDHNGFRVVRIP